MLANTAVFTCNICGEASLNICAYCTKDACANHRCARCKRCSDCCECEVPLSAEEPVMEEPAAIAIEPAAIAIEPVVIAEPPPSEVFARAHVEPYAGGPMLTPEEASVFAFEKREPIEIQEPDPNSENTP